MTERTEEACTENQRSGPSRKGESCVQIHPRLSQNSCDTRLARGRSNTVHDGSLVVWACRVVAPLKSANVSVFT